VRRECHCEPRRAVAISLLSSGEEGWASARPTDQSIPFITSRKTVQKIVNIEAIASSITLSDRCLEIHGIYRLGANGMATFSPVPPHVAGSKRKMQGQSRNSKNLQSQCRTLPLPPKNFCFSTESPPLFRRYSYREIVPCSDSHRLNSSDGLNRPKTNVQSRRLEKPSKLNFGIRNCKSRG
jgi:hypothetical protein